ncbi:MAG: hypothetical protein KME19_13400 [Microcoleus vaginatus WJT46-NPBG5]|nr:hypothetical protein [Microcoleus vaginatus WJT46-NPBG5]
MPSLILQPSVRPLSSAGKINQLSPKPAPQKAGSCRQSFYCHTQLP